MIDNYDKERPILRIKMPLDLPAPDDGGAADQGDRTSRRSGGGGNLGDGGGGDLPPPTDPYVLMLSGSTDPLPIEQFRQFQAAAYNLDDPRLVWSVIAGAGTIKSNGRYYTPSEMPENPSVTIKVASRARPDLFVTRTFLLSDNWQRVTFRLVNSGGLAAIAGAASTWTIVTTGQQLPTAAVQANAGATATVESDQQVDVSAILQVRLNLVFKGEGAIAPGVLWNGNETYLFYATKITDTLYEVNVCDYDGNGAPTWTYFNTSQSFTASCGEGTYGNPVTRTIAAGLQGSTTSPAAANALALAAAEVEANEDLVCGVPTLHLFARAEDAEGRIELQPRVENWNGKARWNIILGEDNQVELGPAYDAVVSAETIEFITPKPTGQLPTGYQLGTNLLGYFFFAFATIDERWQIGNEDGPTFLIDVEVSVELLDDNEEPFDPPIQFNRRWFKFLLI